MESNTSLLNEYSGLLETLYGSLMNDNGFEDFLLQFQDHFCCNSATLMAVQTEPRHMRYGWSVGIPEENMRWYIENDMVAIDPSIDLFEATSQTESGFVSAGTQFEGIDLIDTVDDVFKPWLTAERVVDVAGFVIPATASEHLIMTLQRNADHGKFTSEEITQLNLLSSHITLQLPYSDIFCLNNLYLSK